MCEVSVVADLFATSDLIRTMTIITVVFTAQIKVVALPN